MVCASENEKNGLYKNKFDRGFAYAGGFTKEERLAARKLWNAESQRLHAQLKSDLFEEWKVSGPKAEKLWERAWDRGHSDGLRQVIWEFEDLVELILP